MSALAYAVADSRTMLRRNLRRMARYPGLTVMLIGMPIVFLLLFVYVFGGTLGAGLGGRHAGREQYINYVTPGILLIAVAGVAQGTAISVAMDMTEGILARFRTMAIWRTSVLAGHVVASVIQALVSVVIVLAVAVMVGFRPAATPAAWLETIGLIVLVSLALTWLSVALGLATNSVETASNLPMPLLLLPFLGSGFVPTRSMPDGLRWFAEHQPFTPIMNTLRGLLTGAPVASSALVAIAWCVAITVAAFVWATALYARDPVR